MTDIAMGMDRHGAIDIALEHGDLATEGGLRTAIVLSLLTDRRALADDPLPDGSDDRRGWWADAYTDPAGDQHGSRLWLLGRAQETAENRRRAEAYARESLAWMVEDGLARAVDVQARANEPGRLILDVTVRRPDGRRERFEYLWEGL
ncbi:phage GP46 family protein [Thioalkalivibrio sp. ALMg9]|uniref:phage GP46 family protein n=1 Tax=Thioalkalivibrio sp. ALMg9 TaxID=1266912 RepID=UPI00036B7C3D|nr:phage GP46 family protein [Thioalkalivibrio sp. ALMg9]